MTRQPSRGPLRVGVYGFFGMGNLGNEGSLTAFLSHVRAAYPQAVLCCFGADAEEVRREHGIPAVQLMTYRASREASGPMVLAKKALGRLWDIPRTLWLVGRIDVLVVPGTGVLESRLMSTPWGLPYWLFVAVASCRLRRKGVALISLGAEPAPHPTTRLFMRGIVRLAHYVTYRDAASVEAARSMGGTGTPGTVCPDLAFSLPTPLGGPVTNGHVVIGVMTFLGGADDPGRGDAVREAYVYRMVQTITRLVAEGRTVTLLVGDRADHALADRIADMVRLRRPDQPREAVATSRADDLEQLMREMSRAEVVVASRFHNVICGLKVLRPTVSLGYAGKNEDLLEEFGLGEFSQPIDRFEVDRLVDDVEAAARQQSVLEPRMRATLNRFEGQLAQQFVTLSKALFEPVARSRGRGRRHGDAARAGTVAGSLQQEWRYLTARPRPRQ
jgi:polysaccharide pyruvyl transferase WcaK-like protein